MQAWFSIYKRDVAHSQRKGQNSYGHLSWFRKEVDKIQYLFMIKIFDKSGKERTYPNTKKATYYSKAMESAQVSINRWIVDMWYIATMTFHLVMKKNETLQYAEKWMELKNIFS